MGGRGWRGELAWLAPLTPRIAKAYVVGGSAETIAADLKGRVVAEICRDLETAVAHALADAARSKRRDPVVLLAPACAPAPPLADAAARGEAFRAIVEALLGTGLSGEAA